MSINNSPQYRFGAIGEGRISKYLQLRGWSVLPVYEKQIDTGKGPQLFSAKRNWVAPDLLGFKDQRVEFFESKRKDHFTWSRRCNGGQWETGIDLRHYRDYLEVRRELNRPIWLLFLHESSVASEDDQAHGSPKECPIGLYGSEIRKLKDLRCHEDPRWGSSGMIYWAEKILIKYESNLNEDGISQPCSCCGREPAWTKIEGELVGKDCLGL